MTTVPLTQAALRLGIDPKTLRRWLTDAQLPLHPDPHDARTKGVHAEHLHLLAQLHQRHLTPSTADPSAPEDVSPVPLPPALLALPQTLASLQQQISALQEQVAILPQLLQHPPAPPPTAAQKAAPRATPSSPRPRPVTKAPKKPVHVIPRVEYQANGRYVVICPKKGLLPLEPDSPAWFDWVKEQTSFRFVGKEGHFTAHHWWQVPHGAWRAHRQIRNHSYNVHLTPNHQLTIAVLEQAAQALQAHLN